MLKQCLNGVLKEHCVSGGKFGGGEWLNWIMPPLRWVWKFKHSSFCFFEPFCNKEKQQLPREPKNKKSSFPRPTTRDCQILVFSRFPKLREGWVTTLTLTLPSKRWFNEFGCQAQQMIVRIHVPAPSSVAFHPCLFLLAGWKLTDRCLYPRTWRTKEPWRHNLKGGRWIFKKNGQLL